MVRGLEIFAEHFSRFTDCFVLIGGTACDRLLDAAGLDFRATKDLDLVLCMETLDAEFIKAFWEFIRNGAYAAREKDDGEKCYYRFQKPENESYPVMLELFSRKPDALEPAEGSTLTPIPAGDYISSLSAILMSDDYYRLIQAGRTEIEGLPVVGPEHLIPLKAKAWLDLGARKAGGTHVDSRDIKKHKNDVFRLYQLLRPDNITQLPPVVKSDMEEFLSSMEMESVNIKNFGLGGSNLETVIENLRKIYEI